MLDKFREHGGSWGVKVGAGAIVLVFIFWGYGAQNMTDAGTYAIKVNGRAVPMDDFEQAFRNRQAQSRQQLPTRILVDQVKDELVERALLLQFADEAKIYASREEIADLIKQYFKDEQGNFIGREKYLDWVRNQRNETPAQFEKKLGEDLRVQKAREMIEAAGGKVTPDEIANEFRTRNEKIDLQYVLVDRATLSEALKAKPIAQVDVDAWITTNPGKVEQLYAEQKDARFTTPAKVDLLQITVRKPSLQQKDPDAAAKAKQSSEQALAKAKEDWGEAAKLYAEGAAWEKTGQPREFARRELPAAVADAVFAADMPAGKTAEPKLVETPTSYVIARVVKRTDEKVTELDEAVKKQLVEEQIRDAKAAGEVEAVAKELHEGVKKGEKLEALATAKKLTLKATGIFPGVREEIPGIADSAALVAPAFKLQKPGEVLEIDGGVPKAGESFVVAVLKEHQQPSEADFEQQKMWISAGLQRERSQRAFDAWKAKRIKESKIVPNDRLLPTDATS